MGKKQTTNFHKAMGEVSERFADLIAADIVGTSLSYEAIAAKYRVEAKFVQRVAKQRGINRPKGSGSPAHPKHRKMRGGDAEPES
jgi:ribosome-binding protein aMBF1 (putative translation factor)